MCAGEEVIFFHSASQINYYLYYYPPLSRLCYNILGNANLPSKEWKEMDILLDKNQLIYNCIICPFQEAGIIIKKVHYLFTYTGLIVVLRTDSSAVCDKDIRISLQHGYPYLDDYYVAETF